jgi:predicted AlkP superfamily phosphohydrolase/phosphomutase
MESDGSYMTDRHPRLCIIGLDGANFEMLDRWVAAGHMPNLASLLERGCRGVLRSTFPPVTAPAWTTMTTGVGPGTHGVFGFLKWAPRSWDSHVVRSSDIQVPRLWDLACEGGRTAGVLTVPVTYPATAVNGFMVAGLLSPAPGPEMTHPAELHGELASEGAEPFERPVPEDGSALCARAVLDSHKRGDAVTEHVLRRYSPDLFMCVLRETDRAQHYFWPYCETPGAGDDREIAGIVRELWHSVDSTIGLLLERFGPDANYLVVSDHGAGPGRGACSINQYLQQQGLLSLKPWALSWGQVTWRFLRGARHLLGKTHLLGLARRFWVGVVGAERAQHLARDQFSRLVAAVDWERTRAFARYSSEYGAYVNLAGREAEGAVQPGEDYEAAVSGLLDCLRALRHPDTGEALVTGLWRREELYSPARRDEAPDVLFSMADGSILPDTGLSGPFMKPGRYPGVHRPLGILVGAGPAFRKGEHPEAQIADVTPIALHAMGLPVPRYMEGRVRPELLRDGYLAEHPVRYSDRPPERGPAGEPPAGAPPDEKAVRDRLRGLGYI